MDGGDTKHKQVRENTHVFDAEKTGLNKVMMGHGHTGGENPAQDRWLTHPTAQEQATPVSTSQNHQCREKGLDKEIEGQGQVTYHRTEAREGTRFSEKPLGWLVLSDTMKRIPISQSYSPNRMLFLSRKIFQQVKEK